MQLKAFPPQDSAHHISLSLIAFACRSSSDFFYSSKLYSDINPIIWTWPRGHSFSPRFTNTPNFIIHFQNDIFSWLSCSFNVLWIRFPFLKHSERRTNCTIGKNWRKVKSVTKEIPSISAHLSRRVNWDAADWHVRSMLPIGWASVSAVRRW